LKRKKKIGKEIGEKKINKEEEFKNQKDFKK
jgi:hypothetical protein